MKTELSAGGKEEGKGDELVKIEFLPLDLSSFQSTTDFIQAFKEKNLPLHILINNAALCGTPYSKWQVSFAILETIIMMPILFAEKTSDGCEA